MSERLTKAQEDALRAIVKRGPSCFRPTNQNREQAHVRQLYERGLIERLNRMGPGPTIYEITPEGRIPLMNSRSEVDEERIADLLARVEAATGPSEELDALILWALAAPAGSFVEQSSINGAWCIYTAPSKLWERSSRPGGWYRREGWPITASVDAALALVERVLPGRCIMLATAETGWWARLREVPEPQTSWQAIAPTPTLALIAAMLRALNAKEPT